jgi:hypothetical protein
MKLSIGSKIIVEAKTAWGSGGRGRSLPPAKGQAERLLRGVRGGAASPLANCSKAVVL